VRRGTGGQSSGFVNAIYAWGACRQVWLLNFLRRMVVCRWVDPYVRRVTIVLMLAGEKGWMVGGRERGFDPTGCGWSKQPWENASAPPPPTSLASFSSPGRQNQ